MEILIFQLLGLVQIFYFINKIELLKYIIIILTTLTMDSFKQQKLTRSEWISIEKPIDDKEKIILRMIYTGSKNPSPIFIHNTINNVVHLDHEEKEYYIYVYGYLKHL